MEIKDVITYYDLSKLQKKHLQDMCLELNLEDDGLNDELAYRVWNYISSNNNRSILSNYEDYLLAARGSISWYEVSSGLNTIEGKLRSLNENPFAQVLYYSNDQITAEPKIFGATDPDEQGNYFLRIALRDGNNGNFSMQGKEIVPRIIQCTVFINVENDIIEIRSPRKHTKRIVRSLINLIGEEAEAAVKDTLESYNSDLSEFANALNGKIKESLDIPNHIVDELTDIQIRCIADILKSVDEAIQTENNINLIEEIDAAKHILSEDFPDLSFFSLILAGLGTVRLGASIEDLRSSPLYDSLYPFLDNQGGFIEFEINDQGIETDCLIQVGLKTKTINFSKFSNETAIKFVRDKIFNL